MNCRLITMHKCLGVGNLYDLLPSTLSFFLSASLFLRTCYCQYCVINSNSHAVGRSVLGVWSQRDQRVFSPWSCRGLAVGLGTGTTWKGNFIYHRFHVIKTYLITKEQLFSHIHITLFFEVGPMGPNRATFTTVRVVNCIWRCKYRCQYRWVCCSVVRILHYLLSLNVTSGP